MAKFTEQNFEANVIAVGQFNPPIFAPYWLLSKGLIGQADFDEALANEEFLIAVDGMRCVTSTFSLQVLTAQFSLQSRGPLSPAFADLFRGIFTLLPETPIHAIGMNFAADYSFGNISDFHAVGDTLAPKAYWSSLLADEKHSLGLLSMTMQINPHPRDTDVSATGGVTRNSQISMGVSSKVKAGIRFHLNNHVDIKDRLADTAVELVANEWDQLRNDASRHFHAVLNSVVGE